MCRDVWSASFAGPMTLSNIVLITVESLIGFGIPVFLCGAVDCARLCYPLIDPHLHAIAPAIPAIPHCGANALNRET